MAKSEKINNDEKRAKDIVTYWIIGIVSIIILIVLLMPYYNTWRNTIHYQNLTFTKTVYPGTEIPVYYYSYFFKGKAGNTVKYNLYLRNDPRENNVPVIGGDIDYPSIDTKIYFAINATKPCEDNLVAASTLSAFLAGNEYNVIGAYGDRNLAKKYNGTYASCESRPSSMVINLFWGNETKIVKRNPMCYNIEISKCEDLLLTIEKFEIQSIVDAKKFAIQQAAIQNEMKIQNEMRSANTSKNITVKNNSATSPTKASNISNTTNVSRGNTTIVL